MKKKITIYIAIVCILTLGIFVLSGCQNNEQTENNVSNNKTGNSIRDQIMNAQNNIPTNTIGATQVKLEDLEKYTKEADDNYTTYKDAEGLSFIYPKNWLSVGNETEPAYMSTEGKGATLTISKDIMSEDTTVVTDFDAYMGYQKLYLMQNMTMLSDIKEKQVNLNGQRAYIINYVAETGEDETKAMQLNVTQVAFSTKGNKVYILTMIVVDKYYNDFKDTFEKITKSFILE